MSGVPIEADAEARTLRHLVDRQDFAGAQRSVERYVKLIDAALPLMHAGQAAQQLMAARDLVDWARRNLRAAQTRLSDEMRCVQRLSRYKSGVSAASNTFHLDL